MFYLLTVAVSVLLITTLNFVSSGIYRPSEFGKILLVTVIGVIAVIAIDGLLAFVIRRLPEKWFAPEAKLFFVGKSERKLYRKIKINSWKKYVPEWGCFTGFHKDKMRAPNDVEYIGRFLLESNYGVAGHVAGALLGFLIMLIPIFDPISVALPIAIINFILSTLPTMILRSNTPALRGLYRRNRNALKKEDLLYK